jgi:hypothetical protein
VGGGDVSFSVADPFVIPEDVVLTSVRSLSPALRRELECEEDDCAITRPHSRTPSRVIDASTADLLRQFAEAKPITEAIIAFSRINGTNPEETLVEAFPALQRLVNDGLLVLASSSAPSSTSCKSSRTARCTAARPLTESLWQSRSHDPRQRGCVAHSHARRLSSAAWTAR